MGITSDLFLGTTIPYLECFNGIASFKKLGLVMMPVVVSAVVPEYAL